MGPPKKGRVLQVLGANDSDTVQEFTDLFLRRVLGGYDVSVHRISRADDVSGDVPLIVICFNYSRIGTDINDAMEGVPAGLAQDRMVVVMHVTPPYTQPCIMPTDALSSQYHELGYLVDYIYTTEDKIYKCDVNKTGDAKVDNFLQQHFKRRFAFLNYLKPLLVCLAVGIVIIGASVGATYERISDTALWFIFQPLLGVMLIGASVGTTYERISDTALWFIFQPLLVCLSVGVMLLALTSAGGGGGGLTNVYLIQFMYVLFQYEPLLVCLAAVGVVLIAVVIAWF